jgi:hypothetical protein
MTKDEAKSAFLAMPPTIKMRVLSLFAHNLTVCARSAYLPEVGDALARKRHHGFNELLHTATGQLMHMVAEDLNRYPDEVFMDILFETAGMEHCEGDLVQALTWSYSAKWPDSVTHHDTR